MKKIGLNCFINPLVSNTEKTTGLHAPDAILKEVCIPQLCTVVFAGLSRTDPVFAGLF